MQLGLLATIWAFSERRWPHGTILGLEAWNCSGRCTVFRVVLYFFWMLISGPAVYRCPSCPFWMQDVPRARLHTLATTRPDKQRESYRHATTCQKGTWRNCSIVFRWYYALFYHYLIEYITINMFFKTPACRDMVCLCETSSKPLLITWGCSLAAFNHKGLTFSPPVNVGDDILGECVRAKYHLVSHQELCRVALYGRVMLSASRFGLQGLFDLLWKMNKKWCSLVMCCHTAQQIFRRCCGQRPASAGSLCIEEV